jgi:hypothetical protein
MSHLGGMERWLEVAGKLRMRAQAFLSSSFALLNP